ncbi:unnamed protein product [Pocillopora meandrina]|uniref:NAD-dependent epimerase/dehydratase domain-containing protein n=1 Tax=Pocillopora meandrina TaxID=46732 RepID=A0AAU9VZ26_9CNID|nr:unnamed protein product [Pocillopora meandrina]
MTRVLVTGASGFLALHVVKQLLESGQQYIVRGTVRSLANEQKLKPLRALCPENSKQQLELVEADLSQRESWIDDLLDQMKVDQTEVDSFQLSAGVTTIDKTFPFEANINRAVTQNSSPLSFYLCKGGRQGVEDKVFTEEDWAADEGVSPYEKSKKRAEKAAWELVEKLPDDEKFELCTINPGFIVGPVLGSYCTSTELHRRFLQREMPMVPKMMFGVIDVRDCARAHIIAMTSPKAPGNIYLAITDCYWMDDMARLLHEEFRPLGYKVPTTVAPKVMIKIASWFDGTLKFILPFLNKDIKLDNSKIKDHFGMQFEDFKKSVIDMAYSLIERGFVKKTPQYEEAKKQQAANGSG